METTRENIILEELNNYKWPKQFRCLRCGGSAYGKGKEPFSRRCTNPNCKRVVTIQKFTVFEDLRFSVEKAYGILETIVEKSFLDPDKKIIKVRRHSEELIEEPITQFESFSVAGNDNDQYTHISMLEFIERGRANRMSEDNINKRLQITLDSYRPSIASLAQKFEVEENTVKKFADKVANRIAPDDRYILKDSLNLLINNISDNQKKWTLPYILGMVTVPMPGKWRLGVTKIKGIQYGIKPVPGYVDGPWSVYRISIKKENDSYTYQYHEEYRYGSDEWYELFKEER